MEVCLVRHAIAVERGSAGYDDDRARPLTREGRTRMRESAKGLRRIFVPEVILTSPVLRARQTADILAETFKAPIVQCEGLGTGAHEGVLADLRKRREARVALVGHEPWMSELLSVLVAGDAEVLGAGFKKGAAALVEVGGAPGPRCGTLQWFLPPGILRRLAQAG